MTELASASPPVRCSAFARDVRLHPSGTAGSYDGFLLVEHRLPWARDVTDIEALAPVGPALDASGARYRVQALCPPKGSTGAGTVVHYRRPPGRFRRYARSEHRVDPGGLVEAAGQLSTGDRVLADAESHELLVCTHGARDTCCGSLGTALFTHLPEFAAHVRAWRTSHTGGHRFAPTAILFPEGTMWAYLDEDVLAGIVDRTLPADEAAGHYRGCAGLDGPEVQALDGAVLATVGWGWLDTPRAGHVVARGGASTQVRIEYDGGAWEGTVSVTRVVPVPDCGKPIEAAKKSEPEFAVTDLTQATA